MKKDRRKRIGIFLTSNDYKNLNDICLERKESKSGVIRNLINTQKYLYALKQIETNNTLNVDLLNQITRLGYNLNQIAYHLNIDISSEKEAKTKLEELFIEFQNLYLKFAKKIENQRIDLINTTHIRKLSEKKAE